MVDVNKLIDLLSVDRVNGIRSELIRTGKLANSVIKVDKLSETRFNKMGITLTSIKLQRPFLEMLSSGFEEFQDYYLSRPADRRNKIDAALNIPSHKFWQKVDVAIDWFEKINYATKLVSSEKFPMSAYFPLVRALRNEFDEILQDRGTDGVCKFDSVFGAGCCTELADFIKSRFNMDGDGTSTRKVGLLDRYQIWAYLVDPYKDKLPKQLAIEPSVVEQVNSMLDFFVRSDNQDFQLDVRQKYMEYYSRHGEWLHAFSHLPVRDRMTDEEIRVDQQKLTLAEVSKWATDTGGHDARLQFFCFMAKNALYDMMLEPLLLIRSIGSISVERIAKPMKNNVLSKFRQHLSPEHAEVCLRAGLNLIFLRGTHTHSLRCEMSEK